MTRLLAIDPGPEQSGVLIYHTETGRPDWWAKLPNADVLPLLDRACVEELAIEFVASYGMAVGATVFETVYWTGRFTERWIGAGHRAADAFVSERPEPFRVYRRDVKLHLCGSQRAKDSNIRQALIDRYGPGKAKAVGLKASPGPLYGIKADCWSALAVAVTAAETMLEARVAA